MLDLNLSKHFGEAGGYEANNAENPYLNTARHLNLENKDRKAIKKLITLLEEIKKRNAKTIEIKKAAKYLECPELKVISYLAELIPKFGVKEKVQNPKVTFIQEGQNIFLTINDFDSAVNHLQLMINTIPEEGEGSEIMEKTKKIAENLIRMNQVLTVSKLMEKANTSSTVSRKALLSLVDNGIAVTSSTRISGEAIETFRLKE